MSTQTQDNVAVVDKVSLKTPSQYNIIIHDNPITSFEEVIFIVSRCFEKSEKEAGDIAIQVHDKGKGICGTYSKEIAETKLITVEIAKTVLKQNYPLRANAINALKFTLEEA